MAHMVEVITDDSGKWCANGLCFEAWDEAQAYGVDLANRWTAVRDWRVRQETPEEVTRREQAEALIRETLAEGDRQC